MSQNQFNPLSLLLTNKLSKEIKKSQGIFFTPKSITNQLVSTALSFIKNQNNLSILEPACGTCEIVQHLDGILDNANFTCYELNQDIFQSISKLQFKNKTILANCDFIKNNHDNLYDLIIGNPPYFVCKKESIPKQYLKHISGRPNMFGLFILHSLSKLKKEGILAFIVPKSFFNSIYYASIRNYIRETCKILNIKDYKNNNDFLDTEQSTFGLVLQKLKDLNDNNDDEENDLDLEQVLELNDCDYSLRIPQGGNFVFTPDAVRLKTYLANSTTIQKLGLSVKTGTIVWNEKKELLNNDKTNTILLYNTNVTNDNKILITSFKNVDKGQYINLEGSTDPIIVVNRGNGNAGYNFKYALIEDLKQPYLVENHLNIIYSEIGREKKELIKIYKKIIKSFENEKTKEFIQLFFGNNGLSKTELETILPIYL
jgi:type I restriction-modification system DNA methylase subunit